MSRDQLVRLLLRLAIAFVGLQIVGFVLAFAVFAIVAFGGDMPVGGSGLSITDLRR